MVVSSFCNFVERIVTLDSKEYTFRLMLKVLDTIFEQLAKLNTLNDHNSCCFYLFEKVIEHLISIYQIPNNISLI
jgi:hypothetical protein